MVHALSSVYGQESFIIHMIGRGEVTFRQELRAQLRLFWCEWGSLFWCERECARGRALGASMKVLSDV